MTRRLPTFLDVTGWLAPHLIELAVGLVLVLIVVFTFKRSRSVLN